MDAEIIVRPTLSFVIKNFQRFINRRGWMRTIIEETGEYVEIVR